MVLPYKYRKVTSRIANPPPRSSRRAITHQSRPGGRSRCTRCASLHRALQVLGAGGPPWETRGLHFVWHSFRHGGASRAYLAGRDMSAIILRGRWAAESSARHYVQAGRQMLLALALPPSVATIASRLARIGLAALVAPDLVDRLRAAGH